MIIVFSIGLLCLVLTEVFSMLDKIRGLDIAIGNCNYRLDKAEDNKDLDSFNYWMADRARLQCERAELLNVKLGGV